MCECGMSFYGKTTKIRKEEEQESKQAKRLPTTKIKGIFN